MNPTHLTAPTEFVEANGARYAFRRFGAKSGTPLVFLQHFRGGLDHWDPLVTDGLAANRPVILFNNAGVASSEGQPANTIPGMSEHVIEFVNALGLGQVDLLGFSLGGFVAQQVALDRPQLVRRMILAGTGPEGGEGIANFPSTVLVNATPQVPTEANFLYLFFSPSESSQAAGRAFWKRRFERTDQDLPSSMAVMGAQANAIAIWGAVPSSERYARLRQIQQPVLVINGNNDVMVPVSTRSSCSNIFQTPPCCCTRTPGMARSSSSQNFSWARPMPSWIADLGALRLTSFSSLSRNRPVKTSSKLGAAAFALLACAAALATPKSPAPGKEQLDRGRYMIQIGGCNDCHTPNYGVKNGQIDEKLWLTGDAVGWSGPWGTTYPTNLRVLMATMNERQWVHFARHMEPRPPMPWFNVRVMSDTDLKAIFAFTRSLGPAGVPAPAYVPPGEKAEGPVIRFPD